MEKPKFHTLHRNFNRIGAGLLAAASVGGPAAREAVAMTPNYMPKTSSLRGYDKPLNPETKKRGAEASVQIRWRYIDSEQWYDLCSATMVRVGGQTRVSTAAHCFKVLTGSKDGLLPTQPGPKAVDYAIIAKERGLEYGIFDAQVVPEARQLLAIVNGIAVGYQNDQALASIAPPSSPPVGAPRTIEQIPPLALADTQSAAVPSPARGQKVSITGVQQKNGWRQISSTGRFLGRIKQYNNGVVRYLDIVGLKPPKMEQDNCMPGESGNSYVSTGKYGTAHTSGALSGVINESWASDPMAGNQNGIMGDQIMRLTYQSSLNVDTNPYKTLCIYTANLPVSVRILNAGFGIRPAVPPPPVPLVASH